MNRPGATERISDAMVLALIGAIGGLLGLVWLWGGLAGALFGRGWLTANMAQLPLVLTRLPAHVTHPALAWPQPARLDLPGTFGCYSALGLMLAPLAVAGLLATRRPRPAAAWSGHGGARWAAASELRALRRRRLRGRGHGVRLALGRHHGRLLYAEHRHALVAFGPPQSGKSSGLAIPALLEWEGPVVASSIKTDLLAATLQCRARLGKTYIFDPFGLAGMPSHTWSPLGQARTWDGALEVAWRLAAAGQLDQHSVDNGDFWSIAAEQRLAPLLYIAAVSEAKIDDVVRWAYGQGTRELQDGLDRAAGQATTEAERADVRAAYDAIQAFQAQADRTRSSIEATAQALLRAYRFARVARSARSCEITADRLLDQAATLYLIGDGKAYHAGAFVRPAQTG